MTGGIDAFIIQVIVGSVVSLVLLGVSIIGVSHVLRPRILLRRRMAAMGVIGNPAASEKTDGRRQKRIQDKVKQLEQAGDRKGWTDRVRTQMIQAGVEAPISGFFIASACAGVVLTLIYVVIGLPLIGAVAVFLIGVLGLPKWILGYMSGKRQKRFTQQFADAIDVIVRGLKSGLPVNECFSVIAREFTDPVSKEFHMLVEGQKLGLTLDELLKRGIERVPTAEYKFFAIVIQIQRQTGGNLADTLGNLSEVIRERKKMREKVSALSSEAKSSAMIIGSLPFIVAALLGVVNPGYLMTLFTDSIGHILLGAGAVWGGIGSFVMAKMINFEM